MKELIIVFERKWLFLKKEEITVNIFLNTVEGEVVVRISEQKFQKLEIEIKRKIYFPKKYIKSQGIPQETTILNNIKNRLMSLKLDRATPRETFYLCL